MNDETCLKLVIGLGNPGQQYVFTRHNAGFMCVDKILNDFEAHEMEETTRYKSWRVNVAGKNIWIVKPLTYMNLSGIILPEIMRKFYLKSDDLLVIHDDVYIELGKVRIRYDGSSGGHKGIESIVNGMGTPNFWRLRIGIGPWEKNNDLVSFVLGEFTEDELKILENVLNKVPDMVKTILNQGYEKAMCVYNNMSMK